MSQQVRSKNEIKKILKLVYLVQLTIFCVRLSASHAQKTRRHTRNKTLLITSSAVTAWKVAYVIIQF